MEKTARILWKDAAQSSIFQLYNSGTLKESSFETDRGEAFVTVNDAMTDIGSHATIVTVRSKPAFSFFLRDVNRKMPIYIPEYGVIVTEGDDTRSYDEIAAEIAKGKRRLKYETFEENEESFENAAQHTRNMPCPTWLGIARDVRMFEARCHTLADPSCMWDIIQPFYHHIPVFARETGKVPLQFMYFAGRGIGCRQDIRRWLDKKVLPILNCESRDDDVLYEQKMFVSYEHSPLTGETVHGTHYEVSDIYGAYHPQPTEAQKKLGEALHDAEIFRDEETVLYLRIKAINTSAAPRYAFFVMPIPNADSHMLENTKVRSGIKDGKVSFEGSEDVLVAVTINGKPADDPEYAILLMPGEEVCVDIRIPHRSIPAERAKALMQQDFDARLAECTAYWEKKLSVMADISLPEKRIEEMMKAGFLHLDLITFGNEPDGELAPCVGCYTPIGTESTPIIQYYESIGATDIAKRCCNYFLKKQHENGFIRCFSDYMAETGLAIYNCAEHYKYTKDRAWLEEHADAMIKSCDFLKAWTDENRDEGLRHKGYGMISGNVADCHTMFRDFMMNVTSWAGINSTAEVLAMIGHPEAARLKAFADSYKADILDTQDEAFAVSPVMPLSDGSWCPVAPQWPEQPGATYLFADGGKNFSHGTAVPLHGNCTYNILYGITEPDSAYGSFIIKAVSDVTSLENTGFSQPYYSPHPYGHLLRGETGSFLKEFYNNMSALADRQTYTFWEHYYQVSPHKTHEEGWFLLRCRWMLFLDTYGDELRLLPGIPRAWMQDGKEIKASGLVSRYGKIEMDVVSDLTEGKIKAFVKLDDSAALTPDKITIRLPHPEKQKAVSCEGGIYDAETETVTIDTAACRAAGAQAVLKF